jgi:hypothetical protein
MCFPCGVLQGQRTLHYQPLTPSLFSTDKAFVYKVCYCIY